MSEHGALFYGDGASRFSPRRVGSPKLGAVLLGWPVPLGAPVGRVRGHLRQAATVLVAVGLLTVSWDRLLNVAVASYNVKLPSLVFTLAAVLALLSTGSLKRTLLRPGVQVPLVALTGAIVVLEVVRGALSAEPMSAFAQVAAVLSGAVLPAVALLLVVRNWTDLRWALAWVLAGAVIASAFGVYQLAAFYFGWPQGIEYTGVGIGTGIGRVAAFNYEPAYFAYFIVLALGCFVALRRLDSGDIGWRGLLAVGTILYLANVRAVPLVAVAFGLLLVVSPRRNRALLLRGGVVLLAAVALALATPTISQTLQSIGDRAAQPQVTAPDQSDGRSTAPPAGATEDPSDAPPHSSSGTKVIESQLQSVDPSEQSSNAPRLGLYIAVLQQISDSPIVGIGPGNLGPALARSSPGAIQDQIGGQVVANNIWLQALADGGIVQLLLEVAFVVVVLVGAIRRRSSPIYPLAAAWLAVIGVGGMLTSYFFDIKIWVALALLVVGFSVARAGGSLDRTHKPEAR